MLLVPRRGQWYNGIAVEHAPPLPACCDAHTSSPSPVPGAGALVVVPTYDERITIARLLAALLLIPDVHVLVVDDGSPDGTADEVRAWASRSPRVHLLDRGRRRGLGAAYRAGFAWALEAGAFPMVCEMDADLSHPPGSLPALLARIADGADVAIGSRYVAGGAVHGWPARRRLLSRAGNAYVRALTALPVRDATAGFRVYRAEVLDEVAATSSTSEGYAFQIELTLRAWHAGCRIDEVPIAFVERTEGVSKMNREIVREAVVRVARWGLALRRRRPAVVRIAVPAPVAAPAWPASEPFVVDRLPTATGAPGAPAAPEGLPA